MAVVGVSQDAWKPGSSMLRALLRFGFPGRLYPVSSRGGELMGLEVHPSIASLPEAVDLAFLFVPAPALPAVVRECREKGVRAIIAFTSGFSETGTEAGRALEAELVKEFDGSFRMVGPNCLGVYCPAGGVTQHPGEGYSRESGDVSFIAQSGGLSEEFARSAPNFGFHAGKVISYGNACDLNEADLLEYMEADPATEHRRDVHRGTARRPEIRPGPQTDDAPRSRWWCGKGASPRRARRPPAATPARWPAVSRCGRRSCARVVPSRSAAWRNFWTPWRPSTSFAGHDDLRVGYVCAGGGSSVAAGDASYRAGLDPPAHEPRDRRQDRFVPAPGGNERFQPGGCARPFPLARASLKGILEAMAGSGEVGAIMIDKIVMSTELRHLMHYTDQSPTEDEPWLSEIPIDIQRAYGLPVVVVLRENLDPTGDLAVEAERLRLRRYYQENGIAVYPTADRAFRALGHVIGYYRRGETT